MKVKKIGNWEESGPRGYDHGYYLEAVDLPFQAHRRYAQVAFFAIPDELFPALDRGETVDLALDLDDLVERITDR